MSVLTNLVTVGSLGGKVIFSTSSASQYSGVQLFEGFGAKWYFFTLTGGATATTVTVYGTVDPTAVIIGGPFTAAGGGIIANPSYPAPGSAGGNWFQLNAPSQQGSSDVVNPFTSANGSQYLYITGYTLRAICATTGATQTGTSTLTALAGF